MKTPRTISGLVLWFLFGAAQAQPGLKGDYYVGTNFERKVVTRVDPAISFNWLDRSPAPGLPHSYYSVRWTGKLLAPATGEYYFYAKVDDGIRIWVGNQKVMDSWQLNDSKSFTGNIVLKAGQYYDLRVDFFNDMLEGEIFLYWQRPDRKRLILDRFTTPGEPITAQYFFQKSPLVAVPKKPVSTTPAIATSRPPKALAPKRPVPAEPKPVLNPPPTKTASNTTSSVPSAKPTPMPPVDSKPELTRGKTFVLRNVQFEQSSYVLLPESSAELDNVVQAMATNPQWHIDVAGHTDNVGDPRLNLALSENRAKVVANYLIRHGIADDRITTKGYGGTRPIGDNSTETERSKNRRVEVTIR
jgi:outer membrane protein OmpA-like peptidoglycan-associated protein